MKLKLTLVIGQLIWGTALAAASPIEAESWTDWLTLAALGWIACGALARRAVVNDFARFNTRAMDLELVGFLLGPIGLLMAIFQCIKYRCNLFYKGSATLRRVDEGGDVNERGK